MILLKTAEPQMIKRTLALLFAFMLAVSCCSAEEIETPVSDATPAPTAAPTQVPEPEITTAPVITPSPEPTVPSTPEPEATSVPADTAAPTQAPTQSPAPETTSSTEPDVTSSPEPDITSSPAPDVTVSPEPDVTSSPDPDVSVSPEPDVTSSPDPDVSVSPEPDVTTSPEPDVTVTPAPDITSTPAPDVTESPEPTQAPDLDWDLKIQSAELKGNTWYLSRQEASELSMAWNSFESADSYTIQIESDLLEEPMIISVPSSQWNVSLSVFQNGSYDYLVLACSGDSVVSQYAFHLVIDDGSAEPTVEPEPVDPTPTPDITETPQPTVTPAPSDSPDTPDRTIPNKGSWSRKSSKSKSGSSGKTSSGITAGKALTSTHAAGSGDLTPHDAIVLDLPEEQVSILSLGNTGMNVAIDQGTFSAVTEDQHLVLTSESENSVFSFSQAALTLLHHSGIEDIFLVSAEQTLVVNTSLDFTGYLYGNLRSKGYPSSEFILSVQGETVQVTVDDMIYEVNEQLELTPARSSSIESGGEFP